MCVYGYYDDKGAFFAQNSWGSQWGDQGRFKIDYMFVQNYCGSVMAIVPSCDTQITRDNRNMLELTRLFNAYKKI